MTDLPPGPPTLGDGEAWPPPPPPADDPVGRDPWWRRPVAILGAVALIAAGVGAFAFVLFDERSDGGDPDERRDVLIGEGAADDEPLDPDEVSPAESEAALTEAVEEAKDFVEAERGLRFLEEIDLQVLDDEAYAERLLEDLNEDLAEDEEDLRNAAGFYQALGLWPAGTDVIEVLREVFTAGSLGVYFPDTDEMVVRGSAITPLVRSTLVHELVHALEDQHFDLETPELDDVDDESGFARSALEEGSASRVQSAYEDTLSADERAQQLAEEAQLAAGFDVAAVPPVLFLEQEFQYVTGEEFAQAVFEADGNAAIDAAYADPPVTTEHIFEPASYLAGEGRTRVPVPDADGEVLDSGEFGQFTVDLLTQAGGGLSTDAEWDGGNSVLWRDGDDYCVRATIVGDGAALVADLEAWADVTGSELERDGDEVTLTACG